MSFTKYAISRVLSNGKSRTPTITPSLNINIEIIIMPTTRSLNLSKTYEMSVVQKLRSLENFTHRFQVNQFRALPDI